MVDIEADLGHAEDVLNLTDVRFDQLFEFGAGCGQDVHGVVGCLKDEGEVAGEDESNVN